MLTQERLKELLEYDPETGDFWWKTAIGGIREGSYAGYHIKSGYVLIQIKGKAYYAHRLAWIFIHGQPPRNYIDHINQIKDDNRLENLREATKSQNAVNSKIRIDNSSGFRGVCCGRRKCSWVAQIGKNEKLIHLGYFNSPEEAARAYDKKAVELFGEYARLNFPEPSNIET